MDLGAYAQIEDLGVIAEANGIEVPRLRGYRLMANERPATEEEIAKSCKEVYHTIFRLHYKYGHDEWNGRKMHYRYDKRVPRRDARRSAKRTRKQMETYNKYCGRPDVMMVHARIGGNNWKEYGGIWIQKKPWFIEKVDDGFDPTYCDIYAKIKEVKE